MTSPADGAPRRRSASTNDRRAAVLDAVADLLRDGGSSRFTVGEVADRAGVSRATLYRDFEGGKDELLEEYAKRAIEQFADAVCDAADAQPSLDAAVAAMVVEGRAELFRNDIFQAVIVGEPETLSSVLLPLVHILRSRYEQSLAQRLAVELPDRSEGQRMADARYIGAFLVNLMGPFGSWDLDDPAELRRLVSTFLTSGISSSAAAG